MRVGVADGDKDGAFVGAAVSHLPALHASLAQSLPSTHTEPTPQPGHSAPPQSTSVSRPFLAPSLQDAGVGAGVGVVVGKRVGCFDGAGLGGSVGELEGEDVTQLP
jgi:hypothetical protein